MLQALAPYFLNPLAAAVGIGLLAVPILIHLINRLRYRRVEFAAMEFLLASQQQNRRRVLIEQLLLLLLRLAAVALLTLLIGRLVLDASQLALFRGATLHHIVVLDDSLSTQDRAGRETAFDRGLAYIEGLVGDGETAGRTTLSVYRTSRPEAPLAGLAERTVSRQMASELAVELESLQPTFGRTDWTAVLTGLAERIEADPESIATVHLVTDARSADWESASSLLPSLQAIETAGGQLVLVRTVEQSQPNLTLAGLRPLAATTAVGVPMRLEVTVANGGPQPSERTSVGLSLDGEATPVTVEIEPIAPGEQTTATAELMFQTPGLHAVTATLPLDGLEGDNARSVTLDVPPSNPVLIVDSDPAAAGGNYVADALAADRALTGFAPTVVLPGELVRTPLEGFQAVYLVNVGRVDSETAASLASYVRGGGGLIWFLGEQSRQLAEQPLGPDGAFLLPGRVSEPLMLEPAAEADIVAGDHPIFRVLGGAENPFLDVVDLQRYYRLDDLSDEADVLARLRNNAPLVVEHRLGEGRVVTVLTAAGSQPDGEGNRWNNWAGGPGAPSFAVFVLELQQYVARRRESQTQAVGEPIVVRVPAIDYRPRVEVTKPDGTGLAIDATPAARDPQSIADPDTSPNETTIDRDGTAADEPATRDTGTEETAAEETAADGAATGDTVTGGTAAGGELEAVFTQTMQPGVYRIELSPQTAAPGDVEVRLLALTTAPQEGQLELVDAGTLSQQLAGLQTLAVRSPDEIARMQSSEGRGGLLRTLVAALVVVLVLEQALAYRMGYHTRPAG